MILAPLQKLPKNVGDLGKGFKKLPKVQKIANSGHTAAYSFFLSNTDISTLTIVHNCMVNMCLKISSLKLDQQVSCQLARKP